jgi:hypothetical protein
MAYGDAREGKWRGNWRMEWVASTLHTASEHGASSITTADTHTSPASSRLNWSPRRFKCTRPFRRKTKSIFCACAITFQTQPTPLFSWRFWGQLTKLTLRIVGIRVGIWSRKRPNTKQCCYHHSIAFPACIGLLHFSNELATLSLRTTSGAGIHALNSRSHSNILVWRGTAFFNSAQWISPCILLSIPTVKLH